MTVIRLAAAALNVYANLPEVRPALNLDTDSIDLTGHLLCGSVALHCDGATALFVPEAGGYEGHYMFSSGCPPHRRLRAARDLLDYVFDTLGASTVWGTTPRDNRAADRLTRALGFVPIGTLTDGAGRPCTRYELKRETWVFLPELDRLKRLLRQT